MHGMDASPIADRLDAIAPLAEPVRRALYLHVVGRPDAVGRDEAASAVGLGRPLAAFHLDRLVEAGLLSPSTGDSPAGQGPVPDAGQAVPASGSSARGQPPGATR